MVHTHWMKEKEFRASDDERFTIVALHLTTEKMEILSRSGWKDNVHIDIRLALWIERIISELEYSVRKV